MAKEHRFSVFDKEKSIADNDDILNCFSIGSWRFNLQPNKSNDDYRLYDYLDRYGPSTLDRVSICIRHLDSGIKIEVSGQDAFCHWFKTQKQHHYDDDDDDDVDNQTLYRKVSWLPSYESPLEPSVNDSAYSGKFLFEKPGVESHYIYPQWEDVHWEALSQQAVWRDVYSTSLSLSLFPHFEPLHQEDQHEHLPSPLVNYWGPMIHSSPSENKCSTKTYIEFHLVVIECGWIFSINQNIIPIFRFPHDPSASAEPPRIAHIFGRKDKVECAKSWLANLLPFLGEDEAMECDTSLPAEL